MGHPQKSASLTGSDGRKSRKAIRAERTAFLLSPGNSDKLLCKPLFDRGHVGSLILNGATRVGFSPGTRRLRCPGIPLSSRLREPLVLRSNVHSPVPGADFPYDVTVGRLVQAQRVLGVRGRWYPLPVEANR